jgi:hypothetical protein
LSLPGAGYCIRCGAQLDPGHRFCWRCGAARYEPQSDAPPGPAPPSPGTQPFATPRPLEREPVPAWFPFIYAAGAVFALLILAQNAAIVAAPTGRTQVYQQLTLGGVPANEQFSFFLAYAVTFIALPGIGAGLHAVAFYGLRGRRRWGWAAAVLVAGLWSLLLIGIPFLHTLLKPSTRRAYGLD